MCSLRWSPVRRLGVRSYRRYLLPSPRDFSAFSVIHLCPSLSRLTPPVVFWSRCRSIWTSGTSFAAPSGGQILVDEEVKAWTATAKLYFVTPEGLLGCIIIRRQSKQMTLVPCRSWQGGCPDTTQGFWRRRDGTFSDSFTK